jgi:hypothetical protein
MAKKQPEKHIKKQRTGKRGRPREVEIAGGPRNDPITVQRLSASPGVEGTPTGVQRLSGGTPKVPGVEIITNVPRGEPRSKPTG